MDDKLALKCDETHLLNYFLTYSLHGRGFVEKAFHCKENSIDTLVTEYKSAYFKFHTKYTNFKVI